MKKSTLLACVSLFSTLFVSPLLANSPNDPPGLLHIKGEVILNFPKCFVLNGNNANLFGAHFDEKEHCGGYPQCVCSGKSARQFWFAKQHEFDESHDIQGTISYFNNNAGDPTYGAGCKLKYRITSCGVFSIVALDVLKPTIATCYVDVDGSGFSEKDPMHITLQISPADPLLKNKKI